MTQERHSFTDEQWEQIALRLPPCKGRPGGEQRAFFNALLWMARTGAAWSDLPERLGKWNLVHQRYAYWCDKGHFERLFQDVQQPDLVKVAGWVDFSALRSRGYTDFSKTQYNFSGFKQRYLQLPSTG